ncbi:8-oxo-dGTP diphosphatase MutT [Eionea flava]
MTKTTPADSKKMVHVAVGILQDTNGKILLAKRASHQHQGDLWEFPGGKVEKNETAFDALVREFIEEVDVKITQATPFQQVEHDYGDKRVLLDVWLSQSFEGVARGKEAQPIQWVSISELDNYPFPEANQAIVQALQLQLSHL